MDMIGPEIKMGYVFWKGFKRVLGSVWKKILIVFYSKFQDTSYSGKHCEGFSQKTSERCPLSKDPELQKVQQKYGTTQERQTLHWNKRRMPR
jgi:hypothetical protein